MGGYGMPPSGGYPPGPPLPMPPRPEPPRGTSGATIALIVIVVLLAFAVHPALRHRAAARAGEHFVTRVAFIESPPPPEVKVGDELWDANVATFALSAEEAAAGFHRRVRKLLAGWGFRGHVELRPGGLVVYYAGLTPTPDGYDRLMRITKEIVGKAVAFETR